MHFLSNESAWSVVPPKAKLQTSLAHSGGIEIALIEAWTPITAAIEDWDAGGAIFESKEDRSLETRWASRRTLQNAKHLFSRSSFNRFISIQNGIAVGCECLIQCLWNVLLTLRLSGIILWKFQNTSVSINSFVQNQRLFLALQCLRYVIMGRKGHYLVRSLTVPTLSEEKKTQLVSGDRSNSATVMYDSNRINNSNQYYVTPRLVLVLDLVSNN